MNKKYIVFLINLHQDVNIVRPLAYIASKNLEMGIQFLVSHRFLQMDTTRVWQKEIALICEETGAEASVYNSSYDVCIALQKKEGILVAASESNLTAHAETHQPFLQAPKGFLKVTLQHGFECIGFLQNKEHDKAHGRSITFAADVLCGWFPVERMASMAPSQRPKLYVSGPPSVLHQLSAPGGKKVNSGLICENLHSVRLRANGDVTASYMDIFNQFCAEKAKKNKNVTIRPHPAGQYIVRNNIELPKNVNLNNEPIYKFPLNQYLYGISPPSSILLDMILANLPTAVWGDEAGIMDIGNYRGLTKISSLRDWLDFSEMAETKPAQILKRQRNYLDRLGMPIEKDDVRSRFLRLFAGGSLAKQTVESRVERSQRQARRILYVASATTSDWRSVLLDPLEPLVESGDFSVEVISEETLLKAGPDADAIIEDVFNAFRPDMLVFCDYTGPGYHPLMTVARDRNCPTLYYAGENTIDLSHETDINTASKLSGRAQSAKSLVNEVDLIWSASAPLKNYLQKFGSKAPMISSEFSFSGKMLQPPRKGPVRKIGYSGSDHSHELTPILPALVAFLRKYPLIKFEYFSFEAPPEVLSEFGDRIAVLEPLKDTPSDAGYLADRHWDVGLCPLKSALKSALSTNRKWVEYTSAGIAVIASKSAVYNDCCKHGRGLIVETHEEWLAALDQFVNDDEFRIASIKSAQQKIEQAYTPGRLQQQLFDAFQQAQESFLKRFKVSVPKSKGQRSSVKVLSEPKRILVAADAISATQEISFNRPLAAAAAAGRVHLEVYGDGETLRTDSECQKLWDAFRPTVLFVSRFGDVMKTPLYQLAKTNNIPIIFHLDDNLLKVGKQLGDAKYNFYNDPVRKEALRNAINQSDLLYVSTRTLGKEIAKEHITVPIYSGEIYCTVDPNDIAPQPSFDKPVIGYMGTGGHAADLQMIAPAIDQLMDEFPELRFETFGTISATVDFRRYGNRYVPHKRTATYDEFLKKLSQLGWWAGLAPLEDYDFNLCKADTKWVEYTLAGIPVVASNLSVYTRACSGGGGLMAGSVDGWYEAIKTLIVESNLRNDLVHRARNKLRGLYTHDRLAEQIYAVIAMADEHKYMQSRVKA